MIEFSGLSHINIIVDSIEEASEFYQSIFNAIPHQEFPHFKNVGFAKAAGFLNNPKEVYITIRFLEIPNANVFLELMKYHTPRKISPLTHKPTYEFGGPRDIALKVKNIENTFDFLKSHTDIKMINTSKEYKPFKIEKINCSEFYFFDDILEANIQEKDKVCDIVGYHKIFLLHRQIQRAVGT